MLHKKSVKDLSKKNVMETHPNKNFMEAADISGGITLTLSYYKSSFIQVRARPVININIVY